MVTKTIVDFQWEASIRRDKVIYSVIKGIEKIIDGTSDIRIIESLNDAIKALESIVG